jgi:hypothetical protein
MTLLGLKENKRSMEPSCGNIPGELAIPGSWFLIHGKWEMGILWSEIHQLLRESG